MPPSTSAVHQLVEVLLRAIGDALRAVDQPPPQRRLQAKALSELSITLSSLWSHLARLDLELRDDGIRFEGVAVLGVDDDDVGLVALLRGAGIESLSLARGVELGEMQKLVELLDRKRRLDPHDELDLGTLLFQQALDHVRYTVAADPGGGALETRAAQDRGSLTTTAADGDPTAPAPELETTPAHEHESGESAAERRRAQVRRDAEEEEREKRRGIVELEKFDSTLYFLDRREIEYLRGAIDREYALDHARSVLALLLDVLELQSEPRVRAEVIGVLTTLLPYLLGTGAFESIAYLMAEVRTLQRTVDFLPDQREALRALQVSVSETEALAQLFHALEAGEVESRSRPLGALLGELRPEAVQTVLVWVSQLRNPAAKSALVEAIEGLFTESPATLTRMLESRDRTVVHRALGMARSLRLPELVEPLEHSLGAEDVATRRLAVRALSAIGTAPALRAAVRVVDDPDPEVRRLVFEALAARPFRAAHKRLTGVLGAGDLEERELRERRALFQAFGAVAGAAGVSTLEPLLLGRGGFGKRPSAETRACAAVALGVIGTPAARFALEKATKDRDPLVRSAASSALRAS